jgi:plastocyanin
MRSVLRVVLTGGIALAAAFAAYAQSGVPAEIAQYRNWTRMNAVPLTDPSNPSAAPKNTFINMSTADLKKLVAPGGGTRAHFPDGVTIVRESLDPKESWVRVLFVMRYDSAAAATKGWVYGGYTRSGPDKPFEPLQIADPVARCVNCHAQVRAQDYVFTPYLNRPDPLPARVPQEANRVGIYNYQFGPRDLRVKAGSTVVWANYDAVGHDVKAADKSFESGNLPNQGRYFLTFSKPGTVEYFCAVHLEMRGRVIVEP